MNIDTVIFYTNDLDKVIRFYQEKIGLELEFKQGNKFASFMFENNVRLGVKMKAEDRETPGSQTIIVCPRDIQAKYIELKDKGLEFSKPLTEEDWGIEFSLLDPDENKVVFINQR